MLQFKPYGFIYKTILPDGRYYLGQHKIISHRTLDPTYFGSGVIIKDYIKSCGKENLQREILRYGFSHSEMNDLEDKFITEEVLKDPLSINLDTGGRNKFSRYQEVKNRIGNSVSKHRKLHPEKWISTKGKDNNLSVNWKLVSPDGTEYEFCGGLKNFCKAKGISGNTMSKAVSEGWIPKRGCCANWKLYNLDNGKGTYRDTLNHGNSHSGSNNPYNKGKRNGKR